MPFLTLAPRQLRTVQTVVGIGVVVMLTLSFSALSVVRANNTDGELVSAEGGDSGSGDFNGSSGFESSGSGDGSGNGLSGSDPTAPGQAGDEGAGSDPAAGANGEDGQASHGGAAQPRPRGNGGECPDYNPDEGVSMVLVEQSANLALTITDHSYFIEKGQVRFDGSSAELLERDDLLRSVFLAAGTTN